MTQVTFEIVNQPELADVVMVPGTSKFRVTPKSFEALTSEHSFDVLVRDGELSSDTVPIKFSLMDDEGFSFHSNIPDGAGVVSTKSFNLISSHSFQLNDLRHNEENGSCTGNLQISIDEFESCIGFSLMSLDDFNMTFKVSFDMETGNQYKIRTFGDLRNVFGVSAKENMNHSFNTISELLITEFSGSSHVNINRWFEIYNPSNNVINLNEYSVKMDAIRMEGDLSASPTFYYHENTIFDLPNFDVYPGQYVVIRSQNLNEVKSNTPNTIYLGDSNIGPHWRSNGGEIELAKKVDGKLLTVDYVKFGSNFYNGTYLPETLSEWSGDPLESLALPFGDDASAYSYHRGDFVLDSNTSQDWSESIIATPGNPNDLLCSEDNDRDGLPDCSEEEGSTFFGLDLYAIGARKEQKDIFIEVDYMNSLDEGVIPRQEALRKVRDVFAEQGVKVHFDVGELFGEESEFNLGGGNSLEFSECISFQSVADCKNLYQIKSQNMAVKRLHSFHYMVFGYQTANEDIKGIAEINGNDSMILLGNWDLDSSDEMSKNELINYQAATVMHELGHNLGLRHGGSNDLNLKPNYLSVMNYMYTFNGLPEIGNNEGDRYYTLYWGMNAGSCHGMNNSLALVNSPYDSPEDFQIDYSNGTSLMLNENLIFESTGLGRIGTSSVDYDCNGIIHGGSYERSLADYPNREQYTLLHDHDDWTALNLVFQNIYSGVNNLKAGANRYNMPEDGRITLGNDRSEIAVEIPVTDEFNRLRNLRKSELRSHN